MSGSVHGAGSPPESRGWPHSVPWRLGGFFFLLLLEGAGCLANPGSPSGVGGGSGNNNNSPGVNIYMSVEEVNKLLGKKGRDTFGPTLSFPPAEMQRFTSLARPEVFELRMQIKFLYNHTLDVFASLCPTNIS